MTEKDKPEKADTTFYYKFKVMMLFINVIIETY